MEINICDFIRERVDEMDLDHMVRLEISNLIREKANKIINSIVESESQKLVSAEISNILSREVNTDDGWGKKEHYQKFEDMFKSVFKKKMLESYGIEREIKKHTEARVEALINGKMKEVIEHIVDNLTCSKLVKK